MVTKHLLSIDGLDRKQIERLLDRAEGFLESTGTAVTKQPLLADKRVLNLFFEASTRTRASFELAARNLSGEVVNFAASGSSVDKGESLKDTVQTLSSYSPDVVVIRSPYVGSAAMITRWTAASVINAGDGKHEHPTQALLDTFTLRQRMGSLRNKHIWIVGDVLHSRVARSNIRAFTMMGAKVTIAGPPALIPRNAEALGCNVTYSLDGLPAADVIYTLRMQHERMTTAFIPTLNEYVSRYQIDSTRLQPGQLLMHPGPVNRGVELAPDVVDSPQSLITEQVKAGLVVRMAVLSHVVEEK